LLNAVNNDDDDNDDDDDDDDDMTGTVTHELSLPLSILVMTTNMFAYQCSG